MKTFFVLILISLKLTVFPMGNGKAIFESNTESTVVNEFQDTVNIPSFDEELTETEESEHDSTPIIQKKSGFYAEDFLALLNKNPNWAYSSQLYSCQQLYRLYSNFRL